MEWETVIGLEVHVQLATDTKLFSGSSTAYGAEPNTQASANDLAMPGTLPVPNEAAFRYAVMFGLAVNAEIAKRSVRSEEHTSELQSRGHLVCRLLLETKNSDR